MRGLLIYDKEDYNKNTEYISWLVNEAKNLGMEIILVFKSDFFSKGYDTISEHIEFAINRSRSYEISLILELSGIRVFNNSTVALLGNNKLAAYKYARDKNIRFPRICTSWDNPKGIISKPNNGHGGNDVDLLVNVDLINEKNRLQQEYISDVVGDIRFYILNNKIIHSVIRSSNGGVVSNYCKGGNVKIYDYSVADEELVGKLISGLNIDYAGVDFLLTTNNELVFNEIEDVVGSRMLSFLGINNTTPLFLKHIKNEMKK